LEQKNTNSSETGFRTGTETGPKTVSEPGLSNNQAEDRPVLRTWKHQKSHPLDQILTDLNSGIQIGFQQCTKSFTSSREIRYDTWYQSQKIEQSLVPSGCSETSLMSKEQSPGTRLD